MEISENLKMMTYGRTDAVVDILEQLNDYRNENNLSGKELVLATTPNEDGDVPSLARVKSIAKGIIAGIPEGQLLSTIRFARTDEELSDLIEIAAGVQQIDLLMEPVNNGGLQM